MSTTPTLSDATTPALSDATTSALSDATAPTLSNATAPALFNAMAPSLFNATAPALLDATALAPSTSTVPPFSSAFPAAGAVTTFAPISGEANLPLAQVQQQPPLSAPLTLAYVMRSVQISQVIKRTLELSTGSYTQWRNLMEITVLLLHALCVFLGASLLLLLVLFCFVCYNKWLYPNKFLLEEIYSLFICHEHSVFHSYRPTSVLFF
jgi:hypothetical protein